MEQTVLLRTVGQNKFVLILKPLLSIFSHMTIICVLFLRYLFANNVNTKLLFEKLVTCLEPRCTAPRMYPKPPLNQRSCFTFHQVAFLQNVMLGFCPLNIDSLWPSTFWRCVPATNRHSDDVACSLHSFEMCLPLCAVTNVYWIQKNDENTSDFTRFHISLKCWCLNTDGNYSSVRYSSVVS